MLGPKDVWLFVILPAALLTLSVGSYRLHAQMLRCLKARHEALWTELGKPTIFDALLSAGLAWSVFSGSRRSYVRWLWSRGYETLRDIEITTLGTRIHTRAWTALALVVLWLASAWALGYASFS